MTGRCEIHDILQIRFCITFFFAFALESQKFKTHMHLLIPFLDSLLLHAVVSAVQGR
jgi:hypothetical protein